MRAAIIAAGSEMLGTTRVDTNSLKLTAALELYGVSLVRKSVIGDELGALSAEITHALRDADLLIMTGGLGPTEDDLTREALVEALGLTLEVNQAIIDRIEARFAARGWTMPEVNRRQANVFVGQTTLINERGTAPGFHLQQAGRHVWVFPGVPHELEWMVATYFVPWLAARSEGRATYKRVLKIAGMTESNVEELLKPFYRVHEGEPVTILATGGQIEIHLQAEGEETPARHALRSREREVVEIFGDRIFGFDEDTLESVVGSLLAARRETVATAESCTGGLLASRITDVAGSSAYFLGGGVCYTADAKTDLAGVDPELIRAHGQVSEQVARALAEGIRSRFGASHGIGITGIAGPGGGSEEKPVGTVHIAVSADGRVEHRKLFWPMPRSIFKWMATQSALNLLRLTMTRRESS